MIDIEDQGIRSLMMQGAGMLGGLQSIGQAYSGYQEAAYRQALLQVAPIKNTQFSAGNPTKKHSCIIDELKEEVEEWLKDTI